MPKNCGMDPRDGWNTKVGRSLVSIGAHKLSVSVSDVSRNQNDPIVVCIPGAGDVAASFLAVERLLSPLFARLLLYDRGGTGLSEDRPQPVQHVAVEDAIELHSLLGVMDISAPLILVAHSYGGMVAREYLHLYPDEVAGMVLAESATERQHHYFRVPDPNIDAVLGDLNYARVTGLREESKLTREEWRERAANIARGIASGAGRREAANFVNVCETLGAKKQFEKQALGSKPISVIQCDGGRDHQRMYDAGVKNGNGTEQQREAFRHLLGKWKKNSAELQTEILQLSSCSRLTYVPDCGHHVHMTRPDIICEEIKWLREQILGCATKL